MDTVHIFAALHRPLRLEAEKVGHRQAQEPQRSGMEKIPPADTVTKMSRLVSVESKHCDLSGHVTRRPGIFPRSDKGTFRNILFCLYYRK
jgi:hypothetical protein